MDYTKFTVEELASDDSFVHWVNHTDHDAVTFWESFLLKNPQMKLKVAQARALVLNLRQAESIRHSDQQISMLWKGIEERIKHEDGNPLPIRKKKGAILSSALTFVVLTVITFGTWYFLSPGPVERGILSPDQTHAHTDFIEEVNTSGNVLRVHLSDGSIVALENNSRLKYKMNFAGDSSRSVYLTGEAFFEVARHPGQPFLVYSNDVVTRVLGTSFRVKAPDDRANVVVSVTTGKVSVYAVRTEDEENQSQPNAVILMPNQQVTYIRELDAFGKALVSEPRILLPSIQENDFNFENAPVREVLKTLQKAYGIEIIFDEDIMSNCFFTAPLGSEPLFEKLKIICRAIGARYETIDAKVVITSTGC